MTVCPLNNWPQEPHLPSQSQDISPDGIENVGRLHNPAVKTSLSIVAVYDPGLDLKTWAWQVGPKAAQGGQGRM